MEISVGSDGVHRCPNSFFLIMTLLMFDISIKVLDFCTKDGDVVSVKLWTGLTFDSGLKGV